MPSDLRQDHALGDVVTDHPMGPGIPSRASLVVEATRSSTAASSAPSRNLRVMGVTFPEGVIVKTFGNIIMNGYAAFILAVLIVGPLIILRGYHQGWVIIFYVAFAIGAIAGITGHYRMVWRNRKS